MQSLDQEEFWSDVYRGRPIAVMNRGGQWHVYLNHMLQYNVVFATAEQAIRWLTTRIDAQPCPSANPWRNAFNERRRSPAGQPTSFAPHG